MAVCAVVGCESHSKITPNYTFHRLPRSPLSRARWLMAIGRSLGTVGKCSHVCSRHFADAMFVVRGDTKSLVQNAMPTLFLPKIERQSPTFSTDLENRLYVKRICLLKKRLSKVNQALRAAKMQIPQIQSPKKRQRMKPATFDDVLACRVCLATEVPLYTIAGSRFEDKFVEHTGTPLSAADGLPQWLCAWCRAQLSKCAEFRARCQRSHSLLQTLLEWGPLNLNDIATVDRHAHKLTNNLTLTRLNSFHSHPVLVITPLLKFENDTTSTKVPEASNFTEIEYLEVDAVDNDVKDVDIGVSEEKVGIRQRVKTVKLEHDDNNKYLETEDLIDIELKSDANNVTANLPKEIVETGIKKKIIKLDEEVTGKDMITEDIDSELENDVTDIDTDSSSEVDIIRKRKKAKTIDDDAKTTDYLTKLRNNEFHFTRRRKKVGDDLYPDFDYESFEKGFNLKIRLLTREEQTQEIEDRKKVNKAKFCCEMCGKGYNYENTMKNHMILHDPSWGPYECDVCRHRFRLNRKMLKHRDKHRLAFTCDTCNHVSRDRTTARAHFLMHKGKTYKCRHCEQVYNLRTSYFNHMRIAHPGMNVACDECGETFLSARGVHMHKERAHRTNVKPTTEFKCPVCDVAFLNSAALDKHTDLTRDVSHAALSPCTACGESCGSEAALAAHKAERHPPDQYRCDECNNTFVNAASFDTHVKRKHLGQSGPTRRVRRPRAPGPQQPVVCEVCGRIVKNETVLRYHLNIHLETKPYACPKCPKTFAAKHAREFHVRVHTGERPYQCDECPQAFALRSNFIRHCKVVHLKQRKSVPCELCHKTFTTLSSMQLHVRFVHNNVPWPKRVRKPKKVAAAAAN